MFAFVADIYFSAVRMQNLQQITNFIEPKMSRISWIF